MVRPAAALLARRRHTLQPMPLAQAWMDQTDGHTSQADGPREPGRPLFSIYIPPLLHPLRTCSGAQKEVSAGMQASCLRRLPLSVGPIPASLQHEVHLNTQREHTGHWRRRWLPQPALYPIRSGHRDANLEAGQAGGRWAGRVAGSSGVPIPRCHPLTGPSQCSSSVAGAV